MRRIGRLAPRSRRGGLGCVLAGLLLLAPLAGGAIADSGGSGGLGGFTMFANGNGLQLMLDNPVGLGGSHPVGYIGIPEASSTFETGPQGRALATVIWPGAAIGNLGSLSNVLPIPPEFASLLKSANDPVRAEASTPGGKTDASYPGGPAGSGPVEMSSHADAAKVSAHGAVGGFSIPASVGFGSIVSNSLTVLSATAATSTGTSSVTGLDVLGGLVHIDSIKSTATAMSDGITGKGAGSTVVSGVTVAGQPATIDNNGLHVAQSNTPLGVIVDPLNGLINQAIGALSLKVQTLPSTSTSNGAKDNVLAGAVVITYKVPANVNQVLAAILKNIPQIPNVFADGVVTMTVGGATADVVASPPYAVAPFVATPGAPAGAGSAAVAGSPGSPGSPGGIGTGQAVTSPALAVGSPARRSTTRPQLLAAGPIGFFGVSPGLIALALVGAVLVAAGLRRLCTDVLEPKAVTVCPLAGYS